MATRGVIVGSVALVVLFTLAAGCTFWTGPGGPPATGTPQAATPASTGAGGAEETPSTVATTVPPTPTATTIPTTAVPTRTPTATPTATAVPADAATATETAVATTVVPAPIPTGTGTIAELASADPELSRFVDALRQGGIYETLNGTGTYTVFAPNNAAFDAVPPGTVARLLFDRNTLDSVANYHVIYGRWLSADLVRESSVVTRSGVPLAVTVRPDGTLEVDDGALVTRPDIVATNGVLHVVDRVMIPPGTL